jgi:hypothetical protein
MSNLARCGSARIPNCSPFTHFYTIVRVEEVLRGSRPSFVRGERADVEGADEGCECVGFLALVFLAQHTVRAGLCLLW